MDQQGNGRVIHRPDGSIIWEPLPDSSTPGSQPPNVKRGALSALDMAAQVTLAVAGATALLSSVQHVEKAYERNSALSCGQLTRIVTQSVTATVAGALTGSVLGPIHAVGCIARTLVRPALAGVLLHRGVVWVMKRTAGVAALLRALQSGDFVKQLEALRTIIARATRSEAFRKEFGSFSGIEMIIRMLTDALGHAAHAAAVPGLLPPGSEAGAAAAGSPLLLLLIQALEALLRSNENKDATVNAGGVAVLLRLLSCTAASALPVPTAASFRSLPATASPSTSSSGSISPAASRSSSAHLQQQQQARDQLVTAAAAAAAAVSPAPTAATSSSAAACLVPAGSRLVSLTLLCLSHVMTHPLAQDAIREAGGLPLLVDLAARGGPASTTTAQAVAILQALALDPAAKEAIGSAGGVEVLLDIIRAAPVKSQVHGDAVTALHTLLRGNPTNQRCLAGLPGSAAVLQAALTQQGPFWQPCKADLHALLNVLSRFPSSEACHVGQQEAGALALTPAPLPALPIGSGLTTPRSPATTPAFYTPAPPSTANYSLPTTAA
eukprot:CAMPEP_0202892162 /NCGR_PEP_ID=MMETSP1392-20130828/1958_1 /ASSEMBLY_ACC=CAM_ASM_000868 /TAXON_ID=225041 /ORGANISM="Chlamydomonas chlamydogama, Strain SAG 11-48b" /LENGTH=551 /DNA_ID=CAMNT_0049576045 /DNA_START=219 /DNA_END=1874 /DNA_ORIENTATION=+